MEAEAAKLMWVRSVELVDARYTSKPVSHTHGGFGYEDSLRLLSSYKSSTCHLTLAVKREYIFLREHPFNAADSKQDNSTSQLDQNAVSTMKMCGGNKDGGRLRYVDGDCNCLFNALSVLLLGSRVTLQ